MGVAVVDWRTVSHVGERLPGERVRGDVVLLNRLRAGDDSALGLVYDNHADVVFGIARRVTGDTQVARELTQDVFTYLWEHPDRVDLSRGSLRTYLAVIAHRRGVDEVRRVTRRHRAEDTASATRQSTDDGHEADIVDAAARAWRGDRLATAVDDLPDDQRVALNLAFFEGCTYKQVAELLGIPEGTAKSRLRLALARLRASLTDESEAST